MTTTAIFQKKKNVFEKSCLATVTGSILKSYESARSKEYNFFCVQNMNIVSCASKVKSETVKVDLKDSQT